jgi:hypothetical protein
VWRLPRQRVLLSSRLISVEYLTVCKSSTGRTKQDSNVSTCLPSIYLPWILQPCASITNVHPPALRTRVILPWPITDDPSSRRRRRSPSERSAIKGKSGTRRRRRARVKAGSSPGGRRVEQPLALLQVDHRPFSTCHLIPRLSPKNPRSKSLRQTGSWYRLPLNPISLHRPFPNQPTPHL